MRAFGRGIRRYTSLLLLMTGLLFVELAVLLSGAKRYEVFELAPLPGEKEKMN